MQPEKLGPYRIVRELGRGGMGTVYEAVDTQSGEPAAVKLLAAVMARDAGFRERFQAEIEALRKLNHPHIVRLIGFGEEEGHLFYAMELVAGSSLEGELARGRRFDWREVTDFGIQISQALRHAHDRGIIHRDIKPANLLLDQNNRLKLSDFGIARLFGATGMTAAGGVIGTAEYMSPEQAGGRPVEPRSDLYSLGAVLYTLLAGRPVFSARSIPEMLQKQRFEPAPLVGQYAEDVPEELERIIAQLLQKEPGERVANAMILGRRLSAMKHALTVLSETHVAPSADDQPEAEPGSAPEPDTAAGEGPVDVLADTRLTSAFRELESAPAAPAPPPKPSHFAPVSAEDLDPVEAPSRRPALVSAWTWVLVAALLVVGLASWYFLQPPTADDLYAHISVRLEGSPTTVVEAEDDINAFLSRFPGDPRATGLRAYLREIDLVRLERKLARQAKGLAGNDHLLPVERTYLEAIHYAEIDPQRGTAKLEALIDLYDHGAEPSSPTGLCIELARRRLEQLRKELDPDLAWHRELLDSRLEKADQLRESDPERARAMYRAAIELYGEKPWAAEAVGRAREALEAMPSPADAAPEGTERR